MVGFCLMFGLESCLHRIGTQSFPPAHSATGVTGRVTTGRADYTMELIEVRDTGIIILATRTFRFVPYSAIKSSRFDGIGDSISSRRTPSSKVQERLRLVSRFPQGLTPELLQKLLSANAQTELAAENP